MRSSIAKWKEVGAKFGFQGARNLLGKRLGNRRAAPQATRLGAELLEHRCSPSISIAIDSEAVECIEGQSQVIRLQLSEPALQPVSVSLALLASSTADDSDVEFSATALTIQPGETQATVIATYWHDSLAEPTETIVLGIFSADGAEISPTHSVFVGQILDSAENGSSDPGSTSGGSGESSIKVGPWDEPPDDGTPGGDSDGDPTGSPSGDPESDPDDYPDGDPGGSPGTDPNSPTGDPGSDPGGDDPDGDPTNDPGGGPDGDPGSDPDGEPGESPGDDPAGDPSDDPDGDPDDPGGDPGDDPPDDPGDDPDGQPDDPTDDPTSDYMPEVNFEFTDGRSAEGQFQTIYLTLSEPSENDVTVFVSAYDGSASMGTDFGLSDAQVTFSPGETYRPLRAWVYTDDQIEPTEYFTLQIIGSSQAIVGPYDTYWGDIIDATAEPVPYVIVHGTTADEGSELRFKVELRGFSGSFSDNITVTYEIDDAREAKLGQDFCMVNTSVTLSRTHSVDYFRLYAFTDAVDESTESFYLTNVFAEGLDVRYADPNWGDHSTLGYILNAAPPRLYLDDEWLVEGRSGRMRATTSYPVDVAADYNYWSSNGTATVLAGDYFALSGTLRFQPGQYESHIWVNSRTDKVLGEPVEYYLVNASPLGATQTIATGMVRIWESNYQQVDLSIDSDNDNIIANSDDQIEDLADKPGKFIPVNDSDLDQDGIIGWADFQSPDRFVPIDFRVNGQVNWSTASFSIEYDASDPSDIASSGGAFHPAPGTLRIWNVDGSSSRKPGRLASGGNFVLPGTYTAEQLGLSDAQRSVRFYVEGVGNSASTGESSISFSMTPAQNGTVYSDRVRTTALSVDLDVDSDNDFVLESSEQEDQLEFLRDTPGKIVVANRLDYNANGVPGFADGIDRYGNEGNNRSFDFAAALLALPSTVDRNVAKIRIHYLAADPSLVSRNPEQIGSGDPADYDPGSGNPIRIWTRDGFNARRVTSVAEGGNFVAPGTTYLASDLFTFGAGNGSRGWLYVEGINESGRGDVEIVISVDPDGDAGNAGFVISDRVKLSVAHLQIMFTDVSGITGTATSIQRIERDVEPDGLTADWQRGVEDGSLLLVRVLTSPFLYDMYSANQSKLNIEFGEIDGNYQNLSSRNGSYVELSNAAFFAESRFARRGSEAGATALESLRIESIGDYLGDSGRRVLDARFYRPPDEFDVEESPTGLGWKSRQINLAVKVDGLIDAVGSKPNAITLARAPIVTVHGINANPTSWNDFVAYFDQGPLGYHVDPFRVNHSVGEQGPNSLPSFGNGNLVTMWKFVSQTLSKATSSFRQGTVQWQHVIDFNDTTSLGKTLFEGINGTPKRIAIQKADVVAHSYGGLLARWYIEQAGAGNQGPGSLFNSRRDVRRLVTLGTPHKGSPFANMVTEVFKGGLIANAFADSSWIGYPQFTQLRMDGLLSALDDRGDLARFIDPIFTALDPARTQVRPSYRAMTVNSGILSVLNRTPFHNDVSYAAAVGTKDTLDVVGPTGLNLFRAFSPLADVDSNLDDRDLFPWMHVFNSGENDSDAIVPIWSAVLGVNAFNWYVEANHVELPHDFRVFRTINFWLNGRDDQGSSIAMPLGSSQRAGFNPNPPASERNAYEGSSYSAATGTMSGGGLNRNAIIKVELIPGVSSSDPSYGVYRYESGSIPGFENAIEFGTSADQVGIRPTALTGMIQWKHRNRLQLAIVSDETINDNILDDLGTLETSQLNFETADLSGIGQEDWIAFRVTHGRIGRRADQVLTGPDGVGGYDQQYQWVAYQMSIEGGTTGAPRISGHSRVVLPEYELPAPTIINSNGIELRLTGAAPVSNFAAEDQVNSIRLWDNDGWIGDDLLGWYLVSIPHCEGLWDGLLIGYSFDVSLSIDVHGDVVGPGGSSGEAQAQVYQNLLDADSSWDWSSEYIVVP